MPGKHNAGGCGCCGPCCSVGWDVIRGIWSQADFTLTGYDVAIASVSSPLSIALVKSSVVGGVTVYQCSVGGSWTENVENVPNYYGSGDPRIIGRNVGVNPSTGLTIYSYGAGSVFMSSSNFVCPPSAPQVTVTGNVAYDVFQSADPAATLTGLGFSLSGSTWTLVSGDYTHTVVKSGPPVVEFPGPVSMQRWRIDSNYGPKIFTGATQIATIPSTIFVDPPWNPYSKSAKLDLS